MKLIYKEMTKKPIRTVYKCVQDKEVECGGAPPRVLVLDDYFMTEVEKVEKDPDTGRRVKTKVGLMHTITNIT